MSNHVLELVDLTFGVKPIEWKWIFKRKLKTDGSINKYKVRLVVRFLQRKDINYFDIYACDVNWSLNYITAIYNLYVHQMNAKITFLNGQLDKEIYMSQIKGW